MNIATRKKREWPVNRVFVSSTFTDFKHERDALHQNVFCKLELHCRARGFQFHAIDLCWGVPMEAALDCRTMQICFEELRRGQQITPQPNFLSLLGNRYGWRPLPEVISAEVSDRSAQHDSVGETSVESIATGRSKRTRFCHLFLVE